MNFAQDKQMSGELDDLDHRPTPNGFGHAPSLPPAMMPGKGVRAVRCVGCREETLPRPEDGAPLCHRCSEVLATSFDGPSAEIWATDSTPRWWRRRSSVSLH